MPPTADEILAQLMPIIRQIVRDGCEGRTERVRMSAMTAVVILRANKLRREADRLERELT